MGYGFASYLGLARETTWGTPVAVASGDYLEALNESLTLSIARFETRNLVGRYTAPDDTPGLRTIEGQFVVPGIPHYLAHLLRGATNSGSVTVIATGQLYRHTYLENATDASTLAPLPGYTIEVFRDVTSAFRYAGAVFRELSLAVQPNQDVRATVGVIAKTTSVVARSTPTYVGSPVDPFTFDSASIQVAGAATPYVEGLTVTLNNNLVGVAALANTNEIVHVKRNGPITVTVNATMAFEHLTDYDRFVNQTEFALRASFTRASSFQLELDLPRLVVTAYAPAAAGRERITVPLEARARYHVGSGTTYQVRLTTQNSAY